MVHYRKLSWRTRLIEHKSSLIIGLMIAFYSFVGSLAGTISGPPLLHSLGLSGMFAVTLICGLFIGLGGVVAFSKISRKLFCKDKIMLSVLQEKAMAIGPRLTLDETHQLFDHSLKSKHQIVADFYSKQVLALSMLTQEDSASKQSWMISSDCWASTGEFDKQWMKKMWFLYETRGILTLSPSVLNFQSKKFTFECDPLQIKTWKSENILPG